MRRALCSVWILALALTLASISAKADSFAVSGTAQSDSTEHGLAFSGALSGTTTTPDGPSQIAFFNQGATVNLSLTVPILNGILSGTGPGFVLLTFGWSDNRSCDGRVGFFSYFFYSYRYSGGGFSFTVPVTTIGNVVGFQDLTMGQGFQSQGPQIFQPSPHRLRHDDNRRRGTGKRSSEARGREYFF
jgi:hypothetical protein